MLKLKNYMVLASTTIVLMSILFLSSIFVQDSFGQYMGNVSENYSQQTKSV